MTASPPVEERHRCREAALQMLYAWEVGGLDAPDRANVFWPEHGAALELSGPGREFADALVRGTVEHVDAIDPLIADATEHWRLSRLALLDRLILRLAIFELVHLETPPAVVIDEALELARSFSGEEAVRFVNGVLDAVWKKLSLEADPRR